MTALEPTSEFTYATVEADEAARRRARRMVYESCLISKVPSPVVDEAMNVAGELVGALVARAAGPVQLEVELGNDEVVVRVRDAVGHERSAHVQASR